MLEFDVDDAELMAEFIMNLNEGGLGEVWESIVDGVEERSPSGGCHFFYKVDGEPKGNVKLAFAEDGESATMIETRGQGGQVIASYSAGRTHPSAVANTYRHADKDRRRSRRSQRSNATRSTKPLGSAANNQRSRHRESRRLE